MESHRQLELRDGMVSSTVHRTIRSLYRTYLRQVNQLPLLYLRSVSTFLCGPLDQISFEGSFSG